MNLLASVSVLAAEEGAFEAHHWWLPETKEIIWGGLAFLIVAGLLVWKAGPVIKAGLAARSDRIGKQIDDAAAAKEASVAEAARITADLKDLDAQKAKIIADAQAAAEQLRATGIQRNDVEVAELEAKAQADIQLARTRMSGEVQAQVATLSGDAAERIVSAQLDDAALQDLVEQYIAKVGSAS